MSTTVPAARPAPTAAARPTPAAAAWTLRLLLLLHAAQAVAQPLLIGGYLDGSYGLIDDHGLNGSLLMLSAAAAGLAAVAHWAVGGPAWPVAVLVPLWLAEGVQIGMGQSGNLSVHVPLGAAIVASALVTAVFACRPRMRRRRTGWFR